MVRARGPFKLDNSWPLVGWGLAATLVIVPAVLGFVVLSRYQQNDATLGTWGAICRSLGITADTGPAAEPQPPLVTVTRIAWTAETLDRIGAGRTEHGAFIALNCTACHGEAGVSGSNLTPTLAGMDAAVIYKQLDDFRSRKRLWSVMGAIAEALTVQDSADVAAYFASRPGGLPAIGGERVPHGGRSLRASDPAIRLVFAGDPQRGIAPCAACHGPGGHKIGAPALEGQRADYIERELASFAQGIRQNDINQQMRTVAKQLTPSEMRALAGFYEADGSVRTAQR